MENPNVLRLPDWVRAARKHKKWTLAELGKHVGRTKATIGFWEKGETAPSFEQVVLIAQLTGYPLPVSDVQIQSYKPDEIRRVILELGAILHGLTDMERAGIAPVINMLVADPSLGPEAADMAMRIVQRPEDQSPQN